MHNKYLYIEIYITLYNCNEMPMFADPGNCTNPATCMIDQIFEIILLGLAITWVPSTGCRKKDEINRIARKPGSNIPK